VRLDQTKSSSVGAAQHSASGIDVAANRAARKWSRKEIVGRLLWDLLYPLFAFSPRPMWAWRRALLRLFGARVGRHAHVYPTARISIPWNLSIGDETAIGDRAIVYALGPIAIGQRATISQGAHLCAGTHDYRDLAMRLLKPPISIGDDAWICADAFVGPGVTVGARSIVGARAVVVKDVAADLIVAGNPARLIHPRQSQ
jgi:putative colanic acid biosynthesis acetyltransferase WcaF